MRRSSSSGMWQLIRRPPPTSASGGSTSSQIAPSLRGQRVWKTQPEGGFAARRDVAGEPDARLRPSVERHGGEQRLRVRMVRAFEHRLRRPELHEAAEVEHRDAIGQVADDAEIVRDEDVARPVARACRSTSRLRIAACTETSSAEVGSSQTTSRGSPANARAIATRCFCPPESCVGRAASERSGSRTVVDELAAGAARAARRAGRRASSARGRAGGAPSGGD